MTLASSRAGRHLDNARGASVRLSTAQHGSVGVIACGGEVDDRQQSRSRGGADLARCRTCGGRNVGESFEELIEGAPPVVDSGAFIVGGGISAGILLEVVFRLQELPLAGFLRRRSRSVRRPCGAGPARRRCRCTSRGQGRSTARVRRRRRRRRRPPGPVAGDVAADISVGTSALGQSIGDDRRVDVVLGNPAGAVREQEVGVLVAADTHARRHPEPESRALSPPTACWKPPWTSLARPPSPPGGQQPAEEVVKRSTANPGAQAPDDLVAASGTAPGAWSGCLAPTRVVTITAVRHPVAPVTTVGIPDPDEGGPAAWVA